MTVGAFWTEVARLGGYLARFHDGPASLANHLERRALAGKPCLKALILLLTHVCNI